MPKKTSRTGKSRVEVAESHKIGSSQQVDNLNSDPNRNLVLGNGASSSRPIDSEENINSLPDIEISGVDGPNLELEFPSDDVDRVSVSSYKISEQNRLFAEGNFKQFYNNIAEKTTRAPRCESPLEDKPAVTAQVIDDLIANIGKNNRSRVTPKSVPASITKRSHAAGTPAARPGTRQAGPGTQKHPAKRSNNSQVPNSDSDSDLEPIIRKYKRSEQVKNFKLKIWNMTHPTRSAVDDEPNENVHRNMWNLLHPKGAQLKSKDGRSNLATSTTAGAGFNLQAPSANDDKRGCRMQASLATTESTPILAKDSHNQRPKRGNNRTDFVKLQKQSNANDDPKKVKKSHTVIPKPLQSIVVTQRMKIKAENAETLPRRSRRIQDKAVNEVKPTTSRNESVTNKTKGGSSSVKGSSSKGSVVVEDSVAETSEQTITCRTRSSRKDHSYSK